MNVYNAQPQFPPELQARLDLIKLRMVDFWQFQPHRHFTRQGVQQSQRVETIAFSITDEIEAGKSLSLMEKFILQSAVWLYEIGLQPRQPVPGLGLNWNYKKPLNGLELEVLRSKKHIFTDTMLSESLSPRGKPLVSGLILPGDDVNRAVIEVCRNCSEEPFHNIDELFPVNGEEIRIRLLSTILRLSDRLYIDSSRVNITDLKNFELPPKKFVHWAVYPFVRNFPVAHKRMRFAYILPIWLKGYLANIRGVVERQFDPESNHDLIYLWSNGLILKMHETPLSKLDNVIQSPDETFENRLIDALKLEEPLPVSTLEVTTKTDRGASEVDLITTEGSTQSDLEMQVSLLSHTVPTSYYLHLDADRFPFVSIDIRHSEKSKRSHMLRVNTYIEDISDQAVATIHSRAGENIKLVLLPVLKASKIAGLNNPCKATLHITIDELQNNGIRLYERTEVINLLDKNTALMAIIEPGGSILELFDYLSAWVTPYASGFDTLLRQADKYLPNGQYFVGYQGAKNEKDKAEIIRNQAKAIFQLLHEHVGLTYINSSLSMGQEKNYIAQHIRLPSEIIHAGGVANCIDGTVLFASFLEAVSIYPVMVIIRGHAFVGWKTWKDTQQCEFLETTLIHNGNFEEALRVGQGLYDQAVSTNKFERHIHDPLGFARLVDVRVCRKKNIIPIPN